jgi:hypothetical protein
MRVKALTDVSERAIDVVGSSMWTEESDAMCGQSCGVVCAATCGHRGRRAITSFRHVESAIGDCLRFAICGFPRFANVC